MCCCCCENKESTYWYKYEYQEHVDGIPPLGRWVTRYDQGFITTSDFQSWWLNYKDKNDKLESVVKL